jgi:hypothetical protein
MNRYTLRVVSWAGTVPWAKHYSGRVVGELDQRATIMRGGKWFDRDGNEYPERAEWDVYAHWTEAQNDRWAAGHYEDDGPNQFATEQEVIDAAVKRFTGEWETRWWEPEVPKAEPGDELYYDYIPFKPEEVDGVYGSLLAKIPEREETK